MKRRALTAYLIFLATIAISAERPPNVLVVMADDAQQMSDRLQNWLESEEPVPGAIAQNLAAVGMAQPNDPAFSLCGSFDGHGAADDELGEIGIVVHVNVDQVRVGDGSLQCQSRIPSACHVPLASGPLC